jgi:hypothetical protein
MNAEIMFVDAGLEFELRSAFTVTGPRGLVVLLTEGETPSGYDDIEGLR